jgi:hypothetical protein
MDMMRFFPRAGHAVFLLPRATALLLLCSYFILACSTGDIVIDGPGGGGQDTVVHGDTGAGEDGVPGDALTPDTAQPDEDTTLDPDTPAPDVPADGDATPDTSDADMTPDTPDVLDTDPALCVADNDGVITAAELPVGFGVAPSFMANAAGTTVAVDPHGAIGADGLHDWDFTSGPQDVTASLFVDHPDGYWFADHYPGATFVSPLSPQDPTILAVYQASGDAVRLMGIASDEEDPAQGKTLLVYDAPVSLMSFPLAVGNTYSSTSKFGDAVLMGVHNAGEETYAVTVDARGTLRLPGFTLENTLRLRIEVTQRFVISTGPDPIPSIQYLYLHECVGEVARIISPRGVSDPGFTVAAEYRRLGF